jgi:hypothetical protein
VESGQKLFASANVLNAKLGLFLISFLVLLSVTNPDHSGTDPGLTFHFGTTPDPAV